MAIALGSWSVQDPSLSHATSATVRNILGVPGAIAADLMMQLFGVAALALVLPMAVWGWRLVTHRLLARERLRLMLWTLGALLAAGCLGSFILGVGSAAHHERPSLILLELICAVVLGLVLLRRAVDDPAPVLPFC